MRTSSFGRSSSTRANHSRELESPQDPVQTLPQGEEGRLGYGAMLPNFLNDLGASHRQELVEITLELQDDAVVLRNVGPTTSGHAGEEPPAAAVGRALSTASSFRKMLSWSRSSSSSAVVEDPAITARNARRMKAKLERTRSDAQTALKGLRFISRTTGATAADELWRKVEERFGLLAEDGLLAREDFGECIGMQDSKEFAVGIFDALARRKQRKVTKISKEELRDFWLQITDQSFDARLQIFFDM